MNPPRSAADLPAVLPVFPLAGSILLPRAVVPLNIFEPRYLQMVKDAVAGDGLIGIIQPQAARGAGADDARPPLFGVGGLGRITQWSETGDGRMLIALAGLTRFRVAEELGVTTPYRQVRADYAPYAADWSPAVALAAAERVHLEETLRRYLDAQELSADWDAVANADDESLINTLCAVCPFDPAERQALLEADGLPARASTLAQLMAFAGTGAGSGGGMLQ